MVLRKDCKGVLKEYIKIIKWMKIKKAGLNI